MNRTNGEKAANPGCTFGSPSYLMHRFDDVSKVVVSYRSAMAKLVRSAVERLSTKKDDMYVHRTMVTTGVFEGKPSKSFVAHVVLGLNGTGRQEDYFAALKRLVACKAVKMWVVDVWMDAIDDVMDVLVYCKEATA